MHLQLNIQLKNLLLIVTLLILSSCSGSDSWCFTTDPGAYTNSSVVKVTTNETYTMVGTGKDPTNPSTPAGGWIDTGIGLAKGDQLQVSASGSILIAMPYGLKSTNDGSNDSSYVQAVNSGADTSNYFENNGKGHQIVVWADAASPIMVASPGSSTPFKFVAAQNIYVTTASCAVGDIGSQTPTKWTWQGWDTSVVHCNPRGTRNFTAPAPACKAVKSSCNTQGWVCQHVIESSTSQIVDTCGGGTPTYNCESNSDNTQACYNSTNYQPKDGDWCDGSHKAGGVTVSNISPNCNQRNSNEDMTAPALNSCGTTDTCWNIGGYRLYAVQQNSVCPGDQNCIHLNQSAENSIEGGQNFLSVGGPLYLKIINPIAQTTGMTSEQVADDLKTIDNNNGQIGVLSGLNVNLYNDLYKQAGVTVLADGTTAASDGQLRIINAHSAKLASLEQTATTYNNSTGSDTMSNIIAGFNNLATAFSTFTNQVSPTDDPTIPWTILGYPRVTYDALGNPVGNPLMPLSNSTMDGQTYNLTGLSASITADNTNTSASTTPTSQDIINFQTSLNAELATLSADIHAAQETQAHMDANSAQIDTLSGVNQALSDQILTSNNTSSTNATGGYTAYVRSDSVIASNGQYARAAISAGDPNKGYAAYDLGIISSSSSNTYTSPYAGAIWVRLEDPDGNYGNNDGAYNIIVGKISKTIGFAQLFTTLANRIENTLMLSVKSMYEKMTCTGSSHYNTNCTDYIFIINFMLMTYIVLFGILFLFGMIKIDYVDFFVRIIKIAFIAVVLTPGSFAFFNEYLFQAFLNISNTLIANATGAPITSPFDFVGQSIAVLWLDPITAIKIISLMFQGLIGFTTFILIIYGSVAFIKAMFNAFKVYIMCFIGLTICFALAPIFIPCILFHHSRPLFDNWIKAMMRFAFEPVILIIGLILLNGMLLSLLQQLLNFSACFKCTIPFVFGLPGFTELPAIQLLCMPWFAPWGVDNLGTGIPFTVFMSLPLVLSFCMLTKVMEIYSRVLAKQITGQIFSGHLMLLGGGKHTSMGVNPLAGVYGSTKKAFGLDKTSKERRERGRDALKHANNSSATTPTTGDKKENIKDEGNRPGAGENTAPDANAPAAEEPARPRDA